MNGFEHLITFFEEKLAEQKFGNKPSELYAPINYTLAYGGKRIRPILTLMACEIHPCIWWQKNQAYFNTHGLRNVLR